ncbi:LptE family protein [Nonlabens xiamenensis]|uniref:LptE family protein n=1 Tax=Nonlabens xiamenensis TaxID=2341043 RepID=UPI000F60EFF5|nr:LptE family protein [Nonlabens xiamenensis]
MIYRASRYLLCLLLFWSLSSCGLYSFNNVSIPDNVKTFQVDFFQNQAQQVEPGIDLRFTRELQDLIQDQSSLSLVNTNGDYVYQGEITQYYIAPMTATASSTAAQNRLTIAINVRFTNNKVEEESFEKKYSFYFDYGANVLLTGGALDTALDAIYEQITQEIFNDTLAKW